MRPIELRGKLNMVEMLHEWDEPVFELVEELELREKEEREDEDRKDRLLRANT